MSTITIEPIAGALGANVHGVDLGKPIEDAVFDEFLQAFHTYQVLFLPEQSLNPTSQFALAARFGLPNVYAFAEGLPERPEVVEIIKEPSEAKNFGGVWHSDQPYLERPPAVTILHAKDVPRHGGDTLFASMTLAYEALSPGLKRAIRSLRAINSADIRGRGRARRGGYKSVTSTDTDPRDVFAEHPVVRTHPHTARQSLYVNRVHTLHFQGMSRDESKPLLRFLTDHSTREVFTCRHRWKPGDLALWDNRCTQHFALNDYPGERRHMHRITVEGEVPQ